MQIYAASPVRRSRQIAGDVAALVGIVLAVAIGILIADLIRAVADVVPLAGPRSRLGHLALAVGLILAVVPSLVILRFWLVRRIGFARHAAEARRLSETDGGLQLLAFRALVASDTRELMRMHPNPIASWSAGDALEQRLLAELALRDAGVLR